MGSPSRSAVSRRVLAAFLLCLPLAPDTALASVWHMWYYVVANCTDNAVTDFEWDEAKNQSNIRKHGIDFDIAKRVFGGMIVTEIDGRKDYGEVRYRGIGTVQGKAMVVTYTERFGRTRIISARPASRKERRKYHEKI